MLLRAARAAPRLALIALSFALSIPRARAELHIELLTIEPGEALYERFGHTALRVSAPGMDVVYNYGAAPFSDPAFLWKFARGEGEFWAVAEPYATTLARYRRADRTLVSQELLLDEAAKTELALRLWAATQPGNNRYVYDQLYDNCATRVRDLLDRVSGGALTRAASAHDSDHSYRQDTLAAMAGHPAGHWALDLIGGRHQDLEVTSFHAMYLPLVLRDRVAEARIAGEDGQTPLARPAHVVFARRGQALSHARYAARWIMLGLAGALVAAALGALRSPSRAKRLVAVSAASALALWSSLFGCLVWPLAALSNVHNFSPNENAVLFWPSDVLLVPALLRARVGGRDPRPFLRGYLAFKLLAWGVLLALKFAGLCAQHNGVFVALALLFQLPACALAWPRGEHAAAR